MADGKGANKTQKIAPKAQDAIEEITQEVQQLVSSVGPSLQPSQIDAVYKLIIDHKNKALEVGDRPDKRAYRIQCFEYGVKLTVILCASVVGCVAIYSAVWSAADSKEQSRRVDKLLSELPSIVGGLGGGMILGRQWTKKKPRKD